MFAQACCGWWADAGITETAHTLGWLQLYCSIRAMLNGKEMKEMVQVIHLIFSSLFPVCRLSVINFFEDTGKGKYSLCFSVKGIQLAKSQISHLKLRRQKTGKDQVFIQ